MKVIGGIFLGLAAAIAVLIGARGASASSPDVVYLPNVLTAPAATPTPVPSPTPRPTPTTAPSPSPTAAATCCTAAAWMSDPAPSQDEVETVTGKLTNSLGQGVAGASMHADWSYKTTTPSCDGPTTDSSGQSSCSRNISGATVGYTVDVIVTMEYAGQTYTASSSFTPE